MNLEEMKKALASEATEKAKSLEKAIQKLRNEIREKEAQITEKNNVLKTMFNRCYVQSPSLMCIWCENKKMCDKLRTVGKEDGKV